MRNGKKTGYGLWDGLTRLCALMWGEVWRVCVCVSLYIGYQNTHSTIKVRTFVYSEAILAGPHKDWLWVKIWFYGWGKNWVGVRGLDRLGDGVGVRVLQRFVRATTQTKALLTFQLRLKKGNKASKVHFVLVLKGIIRLRDNTDPDNTKKQEEHFVLNLRCNWSPKCLSSCAVHGPPDRCSAPLEC